MSDIKIAACYIRVSTDDQLEYSPDSQLTAIKNYAAQNGYILPEEYIFVEHEGRSGRNAQKREAFQQMIGTAKIKPKPFDTILLWKFSRFARSREDSILYKSMLRKQCGIDVISVSEPVGDDKMSVIIEALIEAMDEYYSINLAEEVRRGMTEKTRRGEYVSNPPFGYKISDKKLVVIPEQAEIVRQVFQMYVDDVSFRSIALYLNQNNVKTRNNNTIQKRSIIYWLKNPIYHGYVHWSPVGNEKDKTALETMVVKGVHKPIISDDLWDKVQKKLSEHYDKYRAYSRWTASDKFILSGICRCAECGHTLTKSSKIYMHCSGYVKGKCTHTQFVPITDMLDMVKTALIADQINGTFTIEQQKTVVSVDTSAIQLQLSREQNKLERAKKAYLDGIDSADEYKHNKEIITKEINRLQKALEQGAKEQKTPADFAERSQSVLDLLNSDAPNAEKNKALKSLISQAVFSRENKTLKLFYH